MKKFLIPLMAIGITLSSYAQVMEDKKNDEGAVATSVVSNQAFDVEDKSKMKNDDHINFIKCSMYDERIENMENIRSYEISLYKEIRKNGKWQLNTLQKIATMPSNVKLENLDEDWMINRKVYVNSINRDYQDKKEITSTNFIEAAVYDNKEGDVCFNVFIGESKEVKHQENLLFGHNAFTSDVHSVQINKVNAGKNLLWEDAKEKWTVEIKQLHLK